MTPALVLLPGMDGTGRLFAPLLGPLHDRGVDARVVAYPTDVVAFDDLLPLVRAALPEGPFVLLGESFSGPLAVRLAAERPQGLRGLVLCATFVRPPWTAPGVAALVRPAAFSLLPARALAAALIGGRPAPELLAALRDVHATVPAVTLAGRAREVLRVDVRRELAAVDVPVLCLVGRRDRLVRRGDLDAIRAVRPDVVVEALDTPHLVLQSAPAASADLLAGFLARVAP